MAENKLSSFDIILLIVGIGVGILGFHLINTAYRAEGYILGWMMIIGGNWLSRGCTKN